MYIPATKLRIGMVFKQGKNLYRVTYVHHVTPGNKRGFVQSKYRDLNSGIQYEKRFSSEDKIQRVALEHHKMEYLYEDRGEFFFMNLESHEQVSMNRDEVGNIDAYLIPNQVVEMVFHGEKALSVELPASVVLKVAKTVPGLRRATATGSSKPATCETGLDVQVPQFVNEGDLIRVNTSKGEYLERVKK